MNDLKFAFRQLRKNPGFTSVAVLTLALGIGANTAIFQLLDAIRLRSLPANDIERWIPTGGYPYRVGEPIPPRSSSGTATTLQGRVARKAENHPWLRMT